MNAVNTTAATTAMYSPADLYSYFMLSIPFVVSLLMGALYAASKLSSTGRLAQEVSELREKLESLEKEYQKRFEETAWDIQDAAHDRDDIRETIDKVFSAIAQAKDYAQSTFVQNKVCIENVNHSIRNEVENLHEKLEMRTNELCSDIGLLSERMDNETREITRIKKVSEQLLNATEEIESMISRVDEGMREKTPVQSNPLERLLYLDDVFYP